MLIPLIFNYAPQMINHSTYQVLSLTKSDFTALGAIHTLCFGTSAWSEETFKSYFVLPEWGDIVGFGITKTLYQNEVTIDEKSPTCQLVGFILGRTIYDTNDIFTIAVTPDEQGNGLGTILLDTYLKAISVDCLLEVAKGNKPAIRLYDKFGFKHITTRINYYDHPDPEMRDAYVMCVKK